MYVAMNTCNCLDPVLIVSPLVNKSVVRFDYIFIDGHRMAISDQQRYDIICGENISKVLRIPYARNVSRKFDYNDKTYNLLTARLHEFLDNSFLYNSVTSECLPLYQFVPCGRCAYCQSKKLAGIMQRVEFATQQSRGLNSFVTLTFNNDNYRDDPAYVKDCFIGFKKRFRQNLKRYYDHNPHFGSIEDCKFVATCERGKRGRLHVHVLIIGITATFRTKKHRDFVLNHLVSYSWRSKSYDMSFVDYCMKFPLYTDLDPDYYPNSFGYCNVDIPNNNNAVAKYISKYMFKHAVDDDDDMLLWTSVSVNLGLAFARQLRRYALCSLDGSVGYVDCYTNEPRTAFFSSYYIKKLFPSDSKFFPVDLRKKYFNCLSSIVELLACKDTPKEVRKSILYIKAHLNEQYYFMDIFSCLYSGYKHVHDGVYESYDSLKYLDHEYLTSRWCQIVDDYQYIIDFTPNFDDFFKNARERIQFFDKLNKRPDLTLGQLRDAAHKFERDIKFLQSKSIL